MEDYNWPHVDWDRLYKQRTGTISRLMEENDYDALVLTCNDNIRYATNFRSLLATDSNDIYGAIVTPNLDTYLLTPWKGNHANPVPSMPWIKESIGIPSWSPNIYQSHIWANLLGKKLQDLKVKSVGIDDVPFQIFAELKERLPQCQFKSAFQQLFADRAVKYDEELKLLQQTADIISAGASRGYDAVQKSVTEYELMSEIFAEVYKEGAELVAFNLCIHERTSADYFPEDRLIESGDTVVFDVGCYGKGGYCADMTRTAFVGKPPDEVAQAYKVLKDAHLKGIRALTPGTKASQIDALVNKELAESRYTEIPYALGHGIGLRVIEYPHLSESGVDDPVLKEGMTVCIEPEITTKARGREVTCKLEDVILITSTGGKALTSAEYADV